MTTAQGDGQVEDVSSSPRVMQGILVPCAVTFASGFGTMVYELIASRLVSGYVGQSLETWTVIIGVILAGISLGSFLGGWLADRVSTRVSIPALFGIAALFCFVTPWVVDIIGSLTTGWTGSALAWRVRLIVVGTVSFFLPGVALGTIAPTVAKWALDHELATGETVGKVYAANNLGSILGTLVAGFYLIAVFSVSTIIVITSVGLALLAAIVVPVLRSDMSAGATKPQPTIDEEGSSSGLLVPALLVFTSGFAIMMLEFVVSRLVSRHIGQSLYTWTSVIAVVLAGISLGNYLGGKLADAFSVRGLIGSLFLNASIFCLAVLPAQQLLGNTSGDWMGDPDWLSDHHRWAMRVFGLVFLCFFFPTMVLGTISPAVIKWALESHSDRGRTVGVLYAWNSLGSIFGTFVTGFFLISSLYISKLVSLSSLVLALISLPFLFGHSTRVMKAIGGVWSAAALLVAVLACVPARQFDDVVIAGWPGRQSDSEKVETVAGLLAREDEINEWSMHRRDALYSYYDESNYYTIRVDERFLDSNLMDDFEVDRNGDVVLGDDGEPMTRERHLRQLVLDALIHGYVDLEDFKYLHYEYEHIYASLSHRLLKRHQEEGQELRVLFLGGGSFTFPRYLSEFYPGIPCDVAEIDPRVTMAVKEGLGMNGANDKDFLILTDEDFILGGPGSLLDPEASNPELAEEPSDDESLVNALMMPVLKQEDRIRRRIYGVGGRVAHSFDEPVDYVLDLRSDRLIDTPEVQEARERKIPVIDERGLENLIAQPSHENIHTHHGDARQYVMTNPNVGKYDVIYGDAFNDFSVPPHLTTYEFNEQLARLLKPDGIFLANIIDIWPSSRFMGAYRNTLAKVYKHVYLFSTGSGKPSNDRATFVLACSQVPLKVDDLGQHPEDLRGLRGAVMEGELLEPVIRGGLVPLGTTSFVADGKANAFTLPEGVKDVKVTVHQYFEPQDVVVNGNAYIEYDEPPAKGTTVKVSMRPRRKEEEYDSSGEQPRFTIPLFRWNASPEPTTVEGDFVVEIHPPPIEGDLVLRPSLPLKRVGFTADGQQKRFELPSFTVTGEATGVLDPGAYTVDGNQLVFEEPPRAGSRLVVQTYSDQEIILTDDYAPVDNLTVEVTGTRID
ncbi:spermidine synthase [Planctomycetes bacterium Pan216]|uniref:Spermidine synthase n=1 Tax=Kolteria novifilia TaxID=2527975 RepID=A0A518B4G6_9BACT|nr:spermidine synthase [Planctomycetes bacterium Pan216]